MTEMSFTVVKDSLLQLLVCLYIRLAWNERLRQSVFQ